MTIDTEHLKSLLERVTPGEWDEQLGELETSRIVRNKDGVALAVVHSYSNSYGPSKPDRDANAELIAMSKTLARRVIAAEKLVQALRVASLYVLEDAKRDGGEDSCEFGIRSDLDLCLTAITEWDKSQ